MARRLPVAVLTGLGVAVALVVVSLLPDTAILTLTNIPVEPIALVVGIPLGYLALQVMASRDARRFVVGFGVAVVAWFVILYPNISALPLPAAVVAAYQGILPTYLYAFQFPVSTVTRNVDTPLFTPTLAVLSARPDGDLPGGRLFDLGVAADHGREARGRRAGRPATRRASPGPAGPEAPASGNPRAAGRSRPAGG